MKSLFKDATCMEEVTGIGGLFFRAHDPTALGHWYQEHLGVSLTPSSYEEPVWRQQAGPTAFSPFLATSDYFGGPHKDWIVNFRVRDLDKMAAQLQAAGIAVRLIRKSYPNARFARLHDLKEILSNWATRETSPSLGCYNSSGLFLDLSWLGANPSRVRQWQDCRTRLSLSIIAQRPTNFCSSSG